MHPQMICSKEECVTRTHIPGKITAIIATGQAPIRCLLWSLLSLLLRTRPNRQLEHIIVCMSGYRQEEIDRKQRLLEELYYAPWFHADDPDNRRDMPLSFIRSWHKYPGSPYPSYVTEAMAVEMSTNLVMTEAYLTVHDDNILLNANWTDEVDSKFFADPDVLMAYSPALLCCDLTSYNHHGWRGDAPLLLFPNMAGNFNICRKGLMHRIGSRWDAFHLCCEDFMLPDCVDYDSWLAWWREQGVVETVSTRPIKDEAYRYISYDIGAWIFHDGRAAGLKFVPLSPGMVHHIKMMSWDIPWERKQQRLDACGDIVADLEREIDAHPIYGPLYRRHLL